MAKVTVDLKFDSKVNDAFALVYNYDPDLEPKLTKSQFTKKIISGFIQDTVRTAQRKTLQDQLDKLVPEEIEVT